MIIIYKLGDAGMTKLYGKLLDFSVPQFPQLQLCLSAFKALWEFACGFQILWFYMSQEKEMTCKTEEYERRNDNAIKHHGQKGRLSYHC